VTEPADKRDQRRTQILAAAKNVFAERGFHQASINDIIKRADIARGTFYLYFAGKDAVFESILDNAIDDLRGRIKPVQVGDGAQPPGVQLHENVTRVLVYVLGDRDLIQLVLNHGLGPDSPLSQRVDAFFAHVSDLIEASLRYGMEMKLVRECDAELVSQAALGSLRGAVRHLIRQDKPLDIPEIAKQLIDFALRGVVVPDRW
jgi:AcrR family transcriptional regulator